MASTYLTKTFGSAGNRKTWTISLWFKRGVLGSTNFFFDTRPAVNATQLTACYINSSNFLVFGNGAADWRVTTQVFRDTSAWYHLVVAFDSTQGTASNRIKIYINGEQITSFSSSTDPTQNTDYGWNQASAHYIGSTGQPGGYWDGSMAHVHSIDGTAYDADTFGETDATTGIWKPKTAPSVTYGTNGFFLKFENSGAFGTDSSGNSNTFTVNGTMTQNIDTPSNVFATMNSLGAYRNQPTMTNGNLTLTGTGSGTTWNNTVATLGATQGKWYYEFKITGGSQFLDIMVGIINTSKATNPTTNLYTQNGSCYYYGNDGGEMRQDNGETFNDYGAFAQNDIIGIAYDLDTYKFNVYKNGTQIVTDFALSSNFQDGGFIIPSILVYEQSVGSANFGNGYFGTTAVSSAQNPDDGIGIFEYDVPTGYYALNTKAINAQEYD